MPNHHQIIDFSDCPFSFDHGSYGGRAGDKDGILYNNQQYIVKYPKSSRYLAQTADMSYASSPLSEYIGSHIYGILGIPVHETILGIRNGKIIVACKDFCQNPGEALHEMREIKNAAHAQIEPLRDQNPTPDLSKTGDLVDLQEQILHLKHNPVLRSIPHTSEHFWDMVVIDILIDNNDRNNGNWGVIYNKANRTRTLAPVYDDGNAFSNKASDSKLQQYLSEPIQDLENRLTGSRTAYALNNKQLSAKKLLKLNIPELQQALIRNVPNIQTRMPDIQDFIQTIPESHGGKTICSDIRKQYYIMGLQTRLDKLLVPAYQKVIQHRMNRARNLGPPLPDPEQIPVPDDPFDFHR